MFCTPPKKVICAGWMLTCQKVLCCRFRYDHGQVRKGKRLNDFVCLFVRITFFWYHNTGNGTHANSMWTKCTHHLCYLHCCAVQIVNPCVVMWALLVNENRQSTNWFHILPFSRAFSIEKRTKPRRTATISNTTIKLSVKNYLVRCLRKKNEKVKR